MNIEQIDSAITEDVRHDAFGNAIRVGDLVYFVSRRTWRPVNGLKLGIISKFCSEIIKIYDGHTEFNIYDSADTIKTSNEITKNQINDFKKLLNKFNSKNVLRRATLTRFMIFIYKNHETNKKGLGWWMIQGLKEDYNKLKEEKLREMNESGYDVYFAHKKDGKIFFDKTPNTLPKNDGMFTKIAGRGFKYVPYLVDCDLKETRFFDLVEDEKIIEKLNWRRSIEIGDGEKTRFLRGADMKAKDAFFPVRNNLTFEVIEPKVGQTIGYSFDNEVSSIIYLDKIYVMAPANVAGEKKRSFMKRADDTFRTFVLGEINIMVEEENIDEFFDELSDAIHSI